MYLKKIYLENIACFEDISIDLSNSNNSGLFSLILGDNGVGKTTLLRCIALGMCNESGAAALVRELQGDLVRIQGDQYNSVIELELYESNPNKTVTIRTEITETGSGDIELSQRTWPKNNFPWEKIFLCGYGSWRGKYEHQ
ncbi:MAG: AAA family ATPase [Candidatus Marinimicrobia bacterium]|nr:AAA family ATPase [Candidatus Neomarinimicrobiota bacterium]